MITETEVHVIEPERKSKHYKWWFVALGVLITLMGVACLVWPVLSLTVISTIVGVCFLASGIGMIISFFDLGGFVRFDWWSLLGGFIDVLLGLMFLMRPLLSGYALGWIAGAVVIVGGVMDIVAAWRTRAIAGTAACVLAIIGGVITVILGILMVANPALLVIYLGCMAIMRGLMIIIASFQISSIVKRYLR